MRQQSELSMGTIDSAETREIVPLDDGWQEIILAVEQAANNISRDSVCPKLAGTGYARQLCPRCGVRKINFKE